VIDFVFFGFVIFFIFTNLNRFKELGENNFEKFI